MPAARSQPTTEPVRPERWRVAFYWLMIMLGLAFLSISVYWFGYQAGWQKGITFNAELYFQTHYGGSLPLPMR